MARLERSSHIRQLTNRPDADRERQTTVVYSTRHALKYAAQNGGVGHEGIHALPDQTPGTRSQCDCAKLKTTRTNGSEERFVAETCAFGRDGRILHRTRTGIEILENV
ncbi:hypothetical protein ZHAS_00014197 [Anopheles sinensis]|uniref:Uncharacterized protein n=1 Tax=Anopheles sinensis TaxID=74873 RepID=A0A084W7K0_ANOSI|nr:hypothetical protein ZHAS_00014197 [Anopheles sinensis]